MQKEMRREQRILIPEHAVLHCEGITPRFDGRISVIGLSGMFIRARDSQAVGTTLAIRIHGPGVIIETQCVVRNVRAGGMGVEFNPLDEANEGNLKSLLQRLKP